MSAHIHRRGLLGLLLIVPLAGCNLGKKGSGNITTDTRSVGDFTRVEIHGTVHLDLTLGTATAVEITGDDNLVGLVDTRVDGDRLIIEPKESLDPSRPIMAHVTAPNVTHVVGHGASKLDISDVDNSSLELEVRGAGAVTASGKTDALTVTISGAASADVEKLMATQVTVDVSGAGSVDVGSPRKLAVKISGASAVTYSGDPELTREVSGASSLKKR